MLPFLLISCLVFYWLGIKIEKSNESAPKLASVLTSIGVVLGVGVLFVFKYLGFFVDQVIDFLNAIGFNAHPLTIKLLMPLGLSFYTFKLISYPIEIHRRHIEAERNLVNFLTYILFFPTILSGPIDRPDFLNQLKVTRTFNYANVTEGCRQILWGMFKKMVIADNLASATVAAWANYDQLPGIQLIFMALVYTFQMYADFSGYSDMAIGLGKMLGLKVHVNFKYPLYALNIAQYWRGWHISLTSWLTDYVFMPLNLRFRNLGTLGMILAIMINIELVGIWHGANWTFAVFGLYHGLLFIPLILSGAFMKKQKVKEGIWGLPTFTCARKILGTYLLVSLGLVIFAAPDISGAYSYLSHIISNISLLPDSNSLTLNNFGGGKMMICAISLGVYILEWYNRKKEFLLAYSSTGIWSNRGFRYATYYCLAMACFFFAPREAEGFIYVQF